VGQGGLKVLLLDVTHRQPAPPKQKFFFRVQTRLAAFFDSLTGSVEHTAFRRFFSENPRILADAKELSLCDQWKLVECFTSKSLMLIYYNFI